MRKKKYWIAGKIDADLTTARDYLRDFIEIDKKKNFSSFKS